MWGNCTISGNTTVAKANPIRYRGYYYDEDTGLYYCNARYYSPKWRRFISPDSTAYLDAESVNGLNQYCYCNNDPINYTDPSGRSAILISVIIGAVLGGIYGGVSAAANGQNVLGGILIGAFVGGLTSLCIETLTLPYMLLGTFGLGAGGDLLSQWILDGKSVEEWNLTTIAWAGLSNMGLALVGKGLSKIGSDANLTGLTKVLFESTTNSPLMGMGMALNLFGSKQLPEYTVGNMVESIAQIIYAFIWERTGNGDQSTPYQWSPLITQSGQIIV